MTREQIQARIVALVRSYVGCSLEQTTEDQKIRRAALAQLVARQVDDPEQMVRVETNCATTALGLLKVLGAEHQLLDAPYINGKAMTWLMQICRDLGIRKVHGPTVDGLEPGMLLYYCSAGTSNDHVEWLLSPVVEGKADHAGGGRPKNAITEGHGTVTWSSGRPLRYVFDIPSLLERIYNAERGDERTSDGLADVQPDPEDDTAERDSLYRPVPDSTLLGY